MVTAADPKPLPPGEIAGGCLYTIKEACRRLGWSATAFRTARRKGLPVRYMGGRGYIDSTALIAFVLENGKASKHGSSSKAG